MKEFWATTGRLGWSTCGPVIPLVRHTERVHATMNMSVSKMHAFCQESCRETHVSFRVYLPKKPREGKLSGEQYSKVPVLPDRTREVLILSLDVPKSDSMALSLG